MSWPEFPFILFHVPEPVIAPAYVDQIESLLRARVPGPVNFYIEYTDPARAEDKNYQRNLTASLRDTYRGRKLDLVMLSGLSVARFGRETSRRIVSWRANRLLFHGDSQYSGKDVARNHRGD